MLTQIGYRESLDMDHYHKVRDARAIGRWDDGGPDRRNGNIPNHKWVGKTLYRSGKFYTIEKVLKHWFYGNYLVLFCNNGHDSHALVYWENISSVNCTVIESINENRAKGCIIP